MDWMEEQADLALEEAKQSVSVPMHASHSPTEEEETKVSPREERKEEQVSFLQVEFKTEEPHP